MILKRHQKYLQIALNSTLEEAQIIISQIPLSERVLIEAGTPLIKAYGARAIREIRLYWEQRVFGYSYGNLKAPQTGSILLNLLLKYLEKKKTERQNREIKMKKEIAFNPYIVADLKCADLALREVEMAAEAGASAATCLGAAPVETIDIFIKECQKFGIDSMVDMMNVESPILVLEKLKELPDVVILHRGVDEEAFNPDEPIPFRQIQRIKSSYDIMISIAGGDTLNEVERAIFNDADIVVVWKSFYKSTAKTAELAQEFLKEIR